MIAELRMLTAQRGDLVADRTRTINRLRARLLGVFPALERVLDFTNQGPLVLISQFQTPHAIRAVAVNGLESWLRSRKVRAVGKLTAAAVEAADAQHTRIRGESVAAALVADLAKNVLALDRQLAALDKLIATRFRVHRHATIIASMAGIGDLLGAEFLAATGGDLNAFASSSHLAGYAGLAATPRDSGRRTGNLHRPHRYNRQLQRVFYTSAMISISAAKPRKRSTTANEPKENATAKPFWPSPAAALTSSGPCCATSAPTKNGCRSSPLRLDKKIEYHASSTPPSGKRSSCEIGSAVNRIAILC